MSAENRSTTTRLRESRERVIAALQDHFAHDNLDVEEFERRVTAAHTSEALVEIERLVADLGPPPGGGDLSSIVATTTAGLVPADQVRATQVVKGLMSSTTRTGPWSVPRRLEVRAVMSSVVLDFREARFPAGSVELAIRAVMSSVEIIVPPGLSVETHGAAIIGTFDEVDRAAAHPDPDAPVLRIHGRAVMSAVEVKMRLPGETERQSRARQRKDLRGESRQRALPARENPEHDHPR